MEAHRVEDDPWEVAPVLAEADANIEHLERLAEKYSGTADEPGHPAHRHPARTLAPGH